MAKIIVDGVEYEANPDNNLLQECLSQGLDLPYFCWHPCMGSVGACRQCAVKQYKDADDDKGMVVMACMTPASDGSIISISDEQAKLMRERVIESLMINHPHDCPVCEEGGECHLQDMTVMSGHNYRRYDKKKRTHNNQYLGPFISHEMNRCIACYRCVRYYDDYAGGTDLAAQASHHHVYFGRHEEGVLESEFSGNLVEVCPTGVFTDKVFSEHYSRKWDLQTAPSVCTGCAVGCNTTPGERYGQLRRVVNRYNSEVNGYFLCDRGRFGFGYVNSEERLKEPAVTVNGRAESLPVGQAAEVIAQFTGEGVIGIGSPRASNEANYALRRLVGAENFYSGVADAENACNHLMLELAQDSAFCNPGIKDIEKADAILVLGEDITNTAPRVALALRQAVRNKAKSLAAANNIPAWQDAAVRELAQYDLSPLSIVSSYATRLDDIAADKYIDSLSGQVAMGCAIANKLSAQAPAAAGTDSIDAALAGKIAEQLSQAENPLIIVGSSNGNVGLVQAAANIARALHEKRQAPTALCTLMPEVNSMGLTMMTNEGQSLGAALTKISNSVATKAIVLENDLYRRASRAQVDSAFAKLESSLVLDVLPTDTTAKAHYVFPVTTFSEQESTFVNYEGRVQLSYQVHRNHSAAQPAWRWLSDASVVQINDLVADCAGDLQQFAQLPEVLPDTAQFVGGMKIPRQSHRYSGRTAMKANLNVHEPKQAVDDQSVLAFSMEGISTQKNASVLGAAWSPGWNSNQSISKFQEEVNGELKQGDTGILLIKRVANSGAYFTDVSANRRAVGDGLALSPAFQIFGSDELSAKTKAIRERMTSAYISISPQDAQTLSLQQGDQVSLNGNGAIASVCIRSQMKPGTAALYPGDNDINPHELEETVQLQSAGNKAGGTGIKGLIVSDFYEEGY
ncbi:MAG: NADH-quinone oxidoreductase subunit NuoG [Gammaproteobacteria bacterium]